MLSFLTEITQLMSWVITLVAVFQFQRAKSVKLPWFIRAWWLCSFIQAGICIAFDVHSLHLNNGVIGIKEYTDLSSLIACTYLLAISLRGTTGISLSSSKLREPLLQKSTEKHSDKSNRNSPYGRASILQLVTFSWMNPLFSIGIKKPLGQDEVPDVDIKDSAEPVSYSFGECMNTAKERYGSSSLSIYHAIFLFIRKKAAINAGFAVVAACCSYVGPSLIDDFVKFLSAKEEHGIGRGYFLALAFLGAKIVETVCQRQWIFGARQLGLRLRAALISHIYKKALRLSNQSQQKHTSGEIINYMSVDIGRITALMWFSNTVWMLPIQISLAIFVLQKNLGIGALAGLAATFLFMACNIPITRTQKRFQSKIMESKDERMKATSEVLKNMKILKLQAWDTQYLHKLEDLRKIEYGWLWNSLRWQAISGFILWEAPAFISVATFGVCILVGIPLTAGRVLSALATFRMLQDPIFHLPDLLSALAQGKVSADRIASYLQEDEMKLDAVEVVPKSETQFTVEIDCGKFSWDPESKHPTLDGIQLSVRRGMKVAICGTVGSGKSSLLSSILGEIPKLNGTVRISGSKAYVPQSPWILTGNVRDNILFGNPYEFDKYERIIQACALTKDFELFANGDLTEIGERGINMSGGQKQRIQIARSVYQDADTYLLDDPFSAVDAHTGSQLFKDCLMGILKEKTILYVTHQVEFLPDADLILVMQNGRIAQAGKFDELLQQNIGFEVLVGAHSQALESILNAENSSRVVQIDDRSDDELDGENSATQLQRVEKQESEQNLCQDIADRGRLMQNEEREKGSIGKAVYWTYLTAVHGGALVPFIVTAQSLFQILQVASNYWMAWATPTETTGQIAGISFVFLVYILLSVGSSLCVLVRAMLVAITGLLTSQKLFTDMLHCIIRAPMSFFDSTPTGRILNRVSTDQSVVDLEIAGKLGWCAFSVIQILGTVTVMSQVAWPVFLIFIPVTAICIWYQKYYIPTARELARLSGIQRAPILHHFAESLTGAATIRAFGQQERFTHTNLGFIDRHSRPWFHNASAMEWLSFRLNFLSNFVFAFSLVLLVSLPEGFINPSLAGLAVTYGLNLNSQLANIIWNICNTETKMISVERILQYSRIKSEAPLVIEGCQPPTNWPDTGKICFTNLQVRYAKHLPSVLRNITCTIPGRKKVGVVGRTGSGKSTLIQALFRIVEPREGSIIIDDVDICKIGLHDLRSRLSIIPQDPTMFEGTARGNLDPLNQYPDHRIWEVLEKCQLGELVRQDEKKLELKIVENGDNLSVGQRQLFCLGRALLKRSSILVLDEATASVDSATDGIVQKTIRKEFEDCTVVTIAHRIHTVIDSDLILVLSEGRVLEYDTPARLLEREDSAFSKLLKEYSVRSQGFSNLTNAVRCQILKPDKPNASLRFPHLKPHNWGLPQQANLLGRVQFSGSSKFFKAVQRDMLNALRISFSSNSIDEQLLDNLAKEQKESKRHSPYGKATLPQLVTFSWLNPLFAIGIKKPLGQDEVPDVDVKDSAEYLSHSFDQCLKEIKKRYGSKNQSIYRAIFLFIRKKAAINACFAVVSAAASYVGPFLIDDFVKFLSGKQKQKLKSGYILALAFLSAKIVETVAERQWIFGARQLGLRLESALISHVYKKGLRLSNQSRKSHTSGEIINYMNVDIQRITDLMWYSNIIVMLPIQVTLAIYILHVNLGIGSLAGLAATAVIVMCNLPITRMQETLQSKIMAAKDERMKATSEVLRNMKILKLQAWDTKYLHKLDSLRKIEYKWLWKFLRLEAILSFILWESPTLISVVTFGACTVLGFPLTAGRILSALATFRMLQDPIFDLPDLLTVIAQSKVSADRVASYLQEDEVKSDAVEVISGDDTEFRIEIEQGMFSWEPESDSPTLGEIQLKVKKGEKVAICGSVGSGKSTLLSCLLGEVPRVGGSVIISGSMAYVPQSPWMLTCNIRENIILGSPYNHEKYERTIHACALKRDIDSYTNGDLTDIGERGTNMSSGLRQRIQIARAVYQDADIYLLDDPFNAFDSQTGTQIFKECLMGMLRDKTILYVTDQAEFLQAADLILVMENGKIERAGGFSELLQQNKGFKLLVGAHSEALQAAIDAKHLNKLFANQNEGEYEDDAQQSMIEAQDKHDEKRTIPQDVQDEERERGSIGKEVYWSYLTAVGGGGLVVIIVTSECLVQVLQVGSNYWMAWASPPTTAAATETSVEMSFLFLVYMFLCLGSSICVLIRAMLVAIAGLLTSQKHFENMLNSIFHAPMSFFDSKPTERILDRVSSDQSVLDLEIAKKLSWCAFSVIQIFGTITVMSQVAWPVFAIFIPVTAICIWYQQYCIPTARELARISEIQRAPILHHYAESLTGAVIIRALGKEDHFTSTTLSLIDNHSRPCFHNVSAMEWLHFRLNLLSNFVFAFSLVLLVSLPGGVINPSIAGLAVTYGFDLNAQISTIIWNICSTEIKMISVERILQYTKIDSEAPLVIEDCKPPQNWPETGTICIRNLQVGYADNLPPVLKNITCTFPGRKRVGIVGRTGSGKSTLIQSLFRIVEPREGKILIDNVDICKIGLHDLRSKLSIIPQDPTMFEGTVRKNLDPLEEHTDQMIWEVLDKCQVGDLIRRNKMKLDSRVTENGENWSVGQRQLICLGRAFLKNSSILIIDEATASVDSVTDGIVQERISQEFKDCTVVTITHRIHTAIDSDFILVLHDGRVVDYDTPFNLLLRESSCFSRLMREYSLKLYGFNSSKNIN
ncbi:hypothetical protein J5N97_018793 [Dioscorea zingiberensis]|uniref:ABC transporter C family member 15 n=1 Tax=Dioscorea zingiberensis TaxID=325984 RepID=A0A9D5HBU4_9LILI|nr:hypothetical protein J5N97_018793 [Dioscorea zingiberensis]